MGQQRRLNLFQRSCNISGIETLIVPMQQVHASAHVRECRAGSRARRPVVRTHAGKQLPQIVQCEGSRSCPYCHSGAHMLSPDLHNRVNLRRSVVAIVVPNPSHCCPTSSTEWDRVERFGDSKSLIYKTVTRRLSTETRMCKAVDRGMTITDVSVREKRGGKSGDWKADEAGA